MYATFAIVMSLGCSFYILFSYAMTDRRFQGTPDADMFQFPFAVQCLILIFWLNTVLRIFAERDRSTREALYPGAEKELRFRECAGWVLHAHSFWIETVTLGAMFLLLPLESGIYPLAYLLFHSSSLARAVQKLLLLCILLPFTFGFNLWQHISAFYTWQENDLAQRPEGEGNLGGALAGASLLFFVALLALPPIILILLGALSMLAAVSFSLVGAVIAAVILICILYRYLRALRIRGKFLKNLRERCEKCGFSLSPVRRPYRSVFRIGSGLDFTVAAHGKTYSCKLIAGISRGNAMSISPDGVAHVIHIWGLRILPSRHMHISSEFLGGAGRALGGTRWYQKLEILRFTTKTDFSFEGDGQRVLIVNPVPFALFAGSEEQAQPIDNGATVGAYKIFAGTGFLNALERNCIEKNG